MQAAANRLTAVVTGCVAATGTTGVAAAAAMNFVGTSTVPIATNVKVWEVAQWQTRLVQ